MLVHEQVAQCDFQNKGRSHCFGSPTVQLAHQHVRFCTMRPDLAKSPLELLMGRDETEVVKTYHIDQTPR